MADFMAAHPGGTTEAQAGVWLDSHGVPAQITAGVLPVLEEMWLQAVKAGAQAAGSNLSQDEYQMLVNQFRQTWLRQIVATTIGLLAGALVNGAAQFTAKLLIAAIVAALLNSDRARKIAITEITRAMAVAAQLVYQHQGHTKVRWITEHDAKVCPACEANEAAGPWPLGTPFPSGAPFPPEHPGCRCAIVPANGET